jgi:hypothetical protein
MPGLCNYCPVPKSRYSGDACLTDAYIVVKSDHLYAVGGLNMQKDRNYGMHEIVGYMDV